jgi:hypothetical protein
LDWITIGHNGAVRAVFMKAISTIAEAYADQGTNLIDSIHNNVW